MKKKGANKGEKSSKPSERKSSQQRPLARTGKSRGGGRKEERKKGKGGREKKWGKAKQHLKKEGSHG